MYLMATHEIRNSNWIEFSGIRSPLRVAGVDNISDVLTKSLAAPIIAKLRPGLTGYEQLPPPPPRPRD